mmetsp:Transcript_112676/g.224100  ORF Transcript_112676/g.224100 Transcript_112676/m.224100 type:complete len:149 (+) Transcript_112676:47-493(+)
MAASRRRSVEAATCDPYLDAGETLQRQQPRLQQHQQVAATCDPYLDSGGLQHQQEPVTLGASRQARSRSRSRSGHRERQLGGDKSEQGRSLRRLVRDLHGCGLREVLSRLDQAVAGGNVGSQLMTELEDKLGTAVELIEAQRETFVYA